MNAPSVDDLQVAIDVCKDVDQLMEASLQRVKLKSSDRLGLLLVSKALRARLLFLGLVTLAEKRYVAPASALVRCLMEVQYVVEALSKNPAWLDDLIAADERHRRRAMGRLLNLAAEDRAANIDDDIIKEKLASLDPRSSETPVSEWARRAGRQHEYELAYMLLSGDVHASLRGAESHLVLNAAGGLEGITALPETDELPFRLMSACDSMLAVLWVLPDGVCDDAAKERISGLAGDDRKRAINERALKRLEESSA